MLHSDGNCLSLVVCLMKRITTVNWWLKSATTVACYSEACQRLTVQIRGRAVHYRDRCCSINFTLIYTFYWSNVEILAGV